MMKPHHQYLFGIRRAGLPVFLLVMAFAVMPVAVTAFADDEPVRPPKPATFDYQGAIDDLRVDELQMHLGWLADEAQEGRAAGTEGGRRAGDYLAAQLALLGLEPAGTDAGYLQGFRWIDGEPQYRNVLGVIRGGDPDLADEYVMICAHYDHVGVLGGEVYPGANDNASGTSMILELAESFQKLEPRPKRSILVAFWDAEEIGLLGSRHFANHPTVPLNKIKIVFNFDMVGTLQNNRFELFGSNVATGIRETVSRLTGPEDPDIEFSTEYLLASDHSSFYAKRIPAVMFFTGLDCPYHEPDDNFDVIHFEGMKQIADLAFRVVFHLADSDALENIRYLPPREARRDRERAWEVFAFWAVDALGLTLEDDDENAWEDHPGRAIGKLLGELFGGDDAGEHGGLRIANVAAGSCAEQLGLRRGDRIMTLNGRDVEDRDAFDNDILAFLEEEPDRAISLRVARPRESSGWLHREIRPDDPAGIAPVVRRGFLYRESPAEPEVLIVGDVFSERVLESGMQPGDRILQVNGARASGEVLREAEKAKGPLSLEIERNGKISQLELAL